MYRLKVNHIVAIVSWLNIPATIHLNFPVQDCQQLDSIITDVPMQAVGRATQKNLWLHKIVSNE